VQRWRYHSLLVRDLSIAESKLNSEGERGWELVSVCLIDPNTARCFFKMAVEDEEPPSYSSVPEAALVGRAPFA
jgi:hypothetical protein